jgi:hypothetical protein
MANRDPLRVFCDQLIAFFEDISETYPEEADLKIAVPALKLLSKANPRMIHTVFKDVVYTEFAQHILDENEEYVLKRSKEIMETKFSDVAYAFMIFDRHWSTMTETNKQHIWKYMKTLILLCDRVK